MAPEKLHNKPLDEKSDMWSVGVMAYYMLAGYPPFWSSDESKLFQKIKTCDYDYYEEWDNLSSDAQKFVSKLIEPNMKTRLSAAEALQHNWLQSHIIKTPLKPQFMMCLLEHKKLDDF